MIDKNFCEKLIKEISGEVRGTVFQTDAKFVVSKFGEEGLKKLEDRVKELGVNIDYRKAKALEWYPMSYRVLSLCLIKETFNLKDEEIREMGKSAPKVSFIVKFFFRLFLSPARIAKEVGKYWREHFTKGSLESTEINEKEKYFILKLKYPSPLPDIMYRYWEGYFEGTMQLTRKGGTARVKEIKRKENVDYHEYYVTWE